MKAITHMNTNTMDLNMNEMATVNGGDLIDSLSRIGKAMIITHVGKEKERRSKPTVILISMVTGFVKGISK